MAGEMRSVKSIFFVISLLVLSAWTLCVGQLPGSAAGSESQAAEAQATAEVTTTPVGNVSGNFDVNGRSIYLHCLGTGSPTIVFEPGEGGTTNDFSPLQESFADHTTACTYDRANNGQSDSAPIPRTAGDVVKDLHDLLAVAQIAGPYLLVGHSAGGMFVQLYARTYPDQVLGVVAMNPVPPADPWLTEVQQVFSAQEYTDESAYYDGDNGESLDYLTSSEQIAAAPLPPDVPFRMLISTDVQCEGDPICLKSYRIYEQIMKQVTDAWRCGSFSQIPTVHDIFASRPDAVVELVEAILNPLPSEMDVCAAPVETEAK